jgi:hypothetical protein
MDLSEFLSSVKVGERNVLEVIKQVGKDGQDVTRVELAQLVQPPLIPKRAESPPREHRFHTSKGFVSYLQRYKTDATVVLADLSVGVIAASLNEDAPDGREIVFLKPMVHPAYRPWMELFGKTIPLRAFVKFLQVERGAVHQPDGRELVLTLSQLRASKTVTLHEGFGRHSLNGLLCEIDIQGEAQRPKVEPVELPEKLVLRTPMFLGRGAVDIEVDLSLGLDESNKIEVTVCSAQAVERWAEGFDSMVAELAGMDGIIVGHGHLSYGAWSYVEKG